MKSIALALLLCLVPHTCRADFESARAAANRGDFDIARSEWERLAALGDKDSIFSLGRLYARGDGVTKDLSRAFKYFEKAAELGHPRAVLNVGTMYYRGDGVAKDSNRAREFLTRAESLGMTEARTLLKSLGGPSEIPYLPTFTPAAPPRPCEGGEPDRSRPLWFVGLQSGDTFTAALCKLSRVPGISLIRGTSATAKLTAPIDFSYDGTLAATKTFGKVKELGDRSGASSTTPPTILVTDPLVAAQTVQLQKLPFKAVLWFYPSDQPGPYQTIPLGRDAAASLISRLRRVSLSSQRSIDAPGFEELVKWFGSEYPGATRTDSNKSDENSQLSTRTITFKQPGLSLTLTYRGTWVGIRYDS